MILTASEGSDVLVPTPRVRVAEAAGRARPGCSSGLRCQISHADEVVRCQAEEEHPLDSGGAAVAGLAQEPMVLSHPKISSMRIRALWLSA